MHQGCKSSEISWSAGQVGTRSAGFIPQTRTENSNEETNFQTRFARTELREEHQNFNCNIHFPLNRRLYLTRSSLSFYWGWKLKSCNLSRTSPRHAFWISLVHYVLFLKSIGSTILVSILFLLLVTMTMSQTIIMDVRNWSQKVAGLQITLHG